MTRKDVFFYSYIAIWAIVGFSFVIINSRQGKHFDPYLVNAPFLVVFAVIVFFKHFTKFGEWLEKKI